ncbi:hypothetical protein TPDSL_26340 [Terrisporobacter petrolearius]|uniref:hypothetical protein n=1 Tax=Terrisporobacter petrolearius TaxID=1460447 RepID=UPI003366A049
MKKKLVIPFIVVLSLFFYIVSSNINKEVSDYDYGVVYSLTHSKSRIVTYDKSGKLIDDKKLKFRGINLGGFTEVGLKNGDDIYYADPIYKNHINNYIVKINMNTLKAKEVDAYNISPTIFCIDDKYAYTGASNPDGTHINKTDIKKNKVIESTQIDDAGCFLLENKDKLYSINNDDDAQKGCHTNLYILNKSNLKVSDTIDLGESTYVSDAKIIGENMYALLYCDGNDEYSNIMLKINLKEKSIEKIKLPFKYLARMHLHNNNLYVVEYESHDNDTGNRIAKIDLKNIENIKVFKSKNKSSCSYIHDNKFISCDGEYIYTYNIDDFKLLDKFEIKQFDDLNFVSFYIK